MTKCYMVRAMGSTEKDFNIFLSNSVVATGWSEIDFTQYEYNPSALREAVDLMYYRGKNKAPQVVGRNLNEVVRFINIQKGDYIIVPYWSHILMAVSKGEFLYDEKAYDCDLANQLKVSYLQDLGEVKKVPRNALSEGLQRRLRVRGSSVSSLEDFCDEIIRLFDKNETYENTIYSAIQAENEAFKNKLQDVITSGKSNLRTGGMGLEQLVCELMICEGYNARVLPKQKFDGYADADVEAVKDDRFGSKKLFIQVKHHDGVSSSWGIEQLEQIMGMSDYADYEFAFVTSAMLSDESIKRASDEGIIVIDGEGLAEWIMDNVHTLSKETLLKLRISNIPHIVEV